MSDDTWNRDNGQVRASEIETAVLRERWGESANVSIDQIRQAAALGSEHGKIFSRTLEEHARMREAEVKKDPINPSHYVGKYGMEAYAVVEEFELGFCVGNAVKYCLRAGKKPGADPREDLRKAIRNLQQELARLDREGR